MTNLQLFIAIIVPMLFNGALIALLNNNVNVRFASMETRFAGMETRLEMLTGKVAELTDRVTRLEERLERR
ncbi:MAG TPA: hypothetical protein VN924_32430 [Bryobacteraceae bacterium]|nr:hypothetical protein [Bryobacteraceae bacterium]